MDDVRSPERIADVLRPLSPDIICFQEIHQKMFVSGRVDQPDVLSMLLSRPFYFHRTLRIGLGNYGIGIATRATIVARKEHLLPSGKEQRGALELLLGNIDGWRRLTVFCTHWGLDPAERMDQAKELTLLVNAAPRPVVVCGDLNEGPEGEGVQWLLSHTNLLDADASRNRLTYDADNPSVRIDYCLYSAELSLQNCEIISSDASDHLPVLADLERSS